MHVMVNGPSRLPKRFPIGTTYVVEGRSGKDGDLLVSCRYVVLPGGQRINVAPDLGRPGAPRVVLRAGSRALDRRDARRRGREPKKFALGRGTPRQHQR